MAFQDYFTNLSIRIRGLLGAILLLSMPAARGAESQVRPAPPATKTSQIWLDPALPGSLEARELRANGFVREEWFQTGKANVYRHASGGLEADRPATPYTTRLVVIRPRDPRRFSGTVQLNPAHPMMGQANWKTVADHVLKSGDAYVSVMIGADDNTRRVPPSPVPVMATTILKWFDPARYAPIDWPAEEDGIRWDVFADTARLIRSTSGPLAGLKVEKVYAAGWSFTGSFLRTFINEGFHDQARLANGRPLIDGYLIGISSFSFQSGYLPLRSGLLAPPVGDSHRPNVAIDVPVIELMSENEAITNLEPQTPDRDHAPGAHRLYEVPGLTHASGPRGTLAERQIAWRTGQPYAPPADQCPYPQTDIDMAAFAMAAHRNLDRWARSGTPPPRATRLAHDRGTPRRDADGNTLGGIRPAQITVPLARYGAASAGSGCDVPRPGLGSPAIPMRRVPLSAERLRALYPGGANDYLLKFDTAVDKLVTDRWLLPEQARLQKSQARSQAKTAFR